MGREGGTEGFLKGEIIPCCGEIRQGLEGRGIPDRQEVGMKGLEAKLRGPCSPRAGVVLDTQKVTSLKIVPS